MTLALGLAASLVGADLIIAGFTGMSFTSLLFGKWGDTSGTTHAAGGNGGDSGQAGAADSGGTHAGSKTGNHGRLIPQ